MLISLPAKFWFILPAARHSTRRGSYHTPVERGHVFNLAEYCTAKTLHLSNCVDATVHAA
jgi:hypothetical protein